MCCPKFLDAAARTVTRPKDDVMNNDVERWRWRHDARNTLAETNMGSVQNNSSVRPGGIDSLYDGTVSSLSFTWRGTPVTVAVGDYV